MIIGLSGAKQSGKSTVAEYLMRRMEGAKRIPFAFKLKEIAMECYGASECQVNGTDVQKNTMTECGYTGRELMQRLGEAMRGIWGSCWARAWEMEVAGIWAEQGYATPIIVEDVRYGNEVNKIRAMGGIVIRLTRRPIDDPHRSEHALDGCTFFDAIVNNTDLTQEETCAEVMVVCRSKGIL